MNSERQSFEIRLFKNRTLQDISNNKDKLIERFNSGDFWDGFSCELKRTDRLDKKYPGYKVWEPIQIPDKEFRRSPCKTSIIYTQKNIGLGHSLLEYKTIKVCKPCNTANGFVKIDMKDEGYAFDSSILVDSFWKQIGKTNSKRLLLIKFDKTPDFDNTIDKDDLTGDGYFYYISKLFVLDKE